jgi:histidine ammonia-lyase
MPPLLLDGRPISLKSLAQIGAREVRVVLAGEARKRMAASRRVIERIIDSDTPVYGVNTGFGRLSDVLVPPDRLRDLQANLVRSHACGLGPPLPAEETRAMLALRANVLACGYSGARPEVAEHLLAMLAADVLPVIPEKGSVGASGDLAPLAHLALAAIGEGRAVVAGEQAPAAQALRNAGLEPIRLEAKEGLALLNGTQAMAATGGLALHRANHLVNLAEVSGAMTLEALLGTPVAFDARIHEARPHPGQIESARRLRELLSDSEIRLSHLENDPRVQDAYSLRCMPQVHGAVRDALTFCTDVVQRETGAATDNPLVFAGEGDVISGGNFHGAPLAYAFDLAAIALTDLMALVERRVDRMVNPDSNEHLPPFLTADPGACSGFMIPHVVLAALLAEARVLAHPSSVDSVPTSGGKEDHVSMGMTGALKLRSIVDLLEQALAIELLAAAEGLEHRRPLKPGRGVLRAYDAVRSVAPRLEADRSLTQDITAVVLAMRRFDPDSPHG